MASVPGHFPRRMGQESDSVEGTTFSNYSTEADSRPGSPGIGSLDTGLLRK